MRGECPCEIAPKREGRRAAWTGSKAGCDGSGRAAPGGVVVRARARGERRGTRAAARARRWAPVVAATGQRGRGRNTDRAEVPAGGSLDFRPPRADAAPRIEVPRRVSGRAERLLAGDQWPGRHAGHTVRGRVRAWHRCGLRLELGHKLPVGLATARIIYSGSDARAQ